MEHITEVFSLGCQWEHPDRNKQEAVVSDPHVCYVIDSSHSSEALCSFLINSYRMNDRGCWKSYLQREVVTKPILFRRIASNTCVPHVKGDQKHTMETKMKSSFITVPRERALSVWCMVSACTLHEFKKCSCFPVLVLVTFEFN